jgi:hypothetical protein
MDDDYIALPKLYGAPAYARPPSVAKTLERPFDPDELPIEAYQTEDDRDFRMTLPARAFAPGGVRLEQEQTSESRSQEERRTRTPGLRTIASKLIGGG